MEADLFTTKGIGPRTHLVEGLKIACNVANLSISHLLTGRNQSPGGVSDYASFKTVAGRTAGFIVENGR
jgi:hypothetical protein